MKESIDASLRRIWPGIQLTRAEIRDLHAEESTERRHRQAAEDRRGMKETIVGIRKAVVIIGKRGGDFVKIQQEQGAQLRKLIELTEKNTDLLHKNTDLLQRNTKALEGIHKSLRAWGNGKGNGRHA